MAADLFYSIADEVFTRFPGYVRGVVLAYDVRNGPAPGPLLAQLRAAEATLPQRLDLAGIAEHPRIKAWREAYRAMGSKPSEFRSSVEALARRTLRGEPLPAINTLVDIGNLFSLLHLVPAGAHAIDVAGQDLSLRPATGRETFTALGSQTVEHPDPGEIIFAMGDTVLTRRWTWRQGTVTLTVRETTAVEFNVDGLPPVTATEVEEICAAIAQRVQDYCGGHVRTELMSAAQPRIKITDV